MARQIVWVGADGTRIPLTDKANGYRILSDATTGLTAPPYRMVTQQFAGMDGTTIQAITAGPREVVLAVQVEALDVQQLAARKAALVRAMRPKAGRGVLAVVSETGQARYLGCHYTSGLEGSEARDSTLTGRWWRAAIHLYASDPWWYGDQVTLSYSLTPGVPFLSKTLPFPRKLSTTSVGGVWPIDLSQADDHSFPEWKVTGPGSNLVLRNKTTGQVIQVNTTLSDTQSLTIGTTPGFQAVYRNDGTNLMPMLATDPALWPLVEGMNEVEVSMTGAGAGSSIVVTYQPRFAGV